MKYLVVIVVLLVVFWVWRAGRDSAARSTLRERTAPKTTPPQLEMVRCRVCGVHLPETDAVRADAAYYCSVEHLNQAERN